MATNKFMELAASPLMNLDHTYRYSGTKLVEAESLSQHIVDTIMMGLKIIDKINFITGEDTLNPQVYVMKAVYHDLEEVITGDIPRPLKYYNAATQSSMKDVADRVARQFFTEQFEYQTIKHYELWDDAKEGFEGYILKLVDNLVVVNKVIKEVSLLHNAYMLRVAHEVVQYTQTLLADIKNNSHFADPRIDSYIISLLEDAIDSMNEILSENQLILKNLNISSQSMI